MSQPLDQVYQNPVLTSQARPSHSNGSFGPVFIVLAVIVVVSAVACVLGRMCSKRHNRSSNDGSHKAHKAHKQNTTSQGLGPKEWQKPSFNSRDGDIEFGFDKKSSKGGAKIGGGGKPQPTHYNSNPTPYNSNPTSYNSNPTPYNSNPTSYNSNPTSYNGAHRPEQVRYGDHV